MATLEQLRAVFGGTSDEDTLLTASQKLRIPISDIASEVGVSLGGQWGNRFSGSIDNYQAGLYDVGSAATGALGLQGVSDWLGQRRQINERQSEFARQAAKEQGAVTSFKDIGGVGDAFNYLGGLAVDSAPYLGEALAGGLVARGAMTGTRAAMSAARELGMPAAVQAGQRSLARGSVAGAVAASYPSSVGDIMSNQREEAGVTDGATAALLGVPYAAANAFGLEGAAARAGLFRPAVNWFDQAGGIRGGLKRAGVTALTQGAQEGASETFQEVMNQAGRNAVNPAAGYTNPQAMERYLESFVGGGLLGGVAGAAGGGWRRSEGYKPPVSDNPLNPTNLLNSGPPAPETWADLAGPAPAPMTPTTVDPRFTGFGNVDPYSLGDNPYGTYGLTYPRSGGERVWSPAFPEDVLERDVPPVLTADTAGGVGDARYFDDLGTTQWRDLPGTNAARWAAGQPALPDPGSTPMQPGAQMPISGADDPGLALARQRYEEQLRAAEEQKTKAAELQAQVEAAQARHAANRQAAVDALVDKKPDGSPVAPVRDREIATFTALRELHSAGVIDDATYADLAGRMREAYTLDDKMRPKALNAVAKEVASLKEQANAAGAGTDGAARPADVGRGAGDQRAPGERSGVRPAGAQPAAQGVASAGTTQLGPAGERGDGALTEPVATPAQRAARVIGRALSPAEQQLADRLASANPRDQQLVRDVLGWDTDNDQVNDPLTYEQAAAKHGVSRQAVQQALKRMGINQKVVDAVRGDFVEAVDAQELTGAAGEATGFRVTDKQLAGADDFELDARTKRDQKATDEYLKANGGSAVAAVDPAKQERDAEIHRRNQERAVRGLIAWLDSPENAENVRLSGVDWDDARSEGVPAYDQLPLHVRALWARDYIAQYEETGDDWDPIQRAFDEFVADHADKLAPQAGVDASGAGEPRVAGRAEPAGRDVLRLESPQEGASDEDLTPDRRRFDPENLHDLTSDELQARLDEARAHNERVDRAGLTRFFGPRAALEVMAKGQRAREKWLNANLTDDQDSWFQERYIADEALTDLVRGADDFDTESAERLGRSIAVGARKIDDPGFFSTPEGFRVRRALNYARQQGWNMDAVLRGMRERSTQWAGDDAPELFSRLFRPASPKLSSQATPRIETDESWGNQLERSRGDTAADTVYDRDQLEDDLLTFMNADSLGRHVLIVDDASELTNAADMEAAMDPSTRAWVRGNKAVLIANRIPAGQGRSIFLHELGSHLGLQRMLTEREFGALTGKIISWANRNDNSLETRLAKRAVERVNQAGESDPTQRLNELTAYFVEEAVRAGIDPTKTNHSTELLQWMRRLWAGIKVALRKLGVNPDKLTAQDVVELAYGAARLNVTGRFHGTAAKVQQFRTKYIGTGEGAQAYGWGLYFSELRGVANEYKKSDVQRKQSAKSAQDYPAFARMKALAKAEDYLGFDTLGDMLHAYVADRKAGREEAFLDSYDISDDLRSTLVNFGHWWAKPAQNAKGNLYATDIAIRDDEFLDWTKPLDEQPRAVQSVLASPELQVVLADFKQSPFEQTGGGLYRYMEAMADEQGLAQPSDILAPADVKRYEAGAMPAAEMASKWFDAYGVKGVRMPVNAMRGGGYESGANFVVFNEKNVIRVFDNPENRVSRSVQYSKAPASVQVAAKLTEALPQPAQNAWTDIKDFAARKMPYVMTTFQIFEQFGSKLKRLGGMIRANDLMRQESTALQMKVDDIVKRWDKLPKAAGELLSQVALRATLLGAHPDKAWGHEANAHVPRERQGEYNELRQLYDRLKATSPEGVKLYHDALAAFEDQRQQLEKATERMFEQYGKVMPKVKRVPGPYFPLVRRGDYLAIGESQQLVALKKQLEALAKTEGNDEAIADLNSRIDQLEADGQHFWVSAHEHRSGMENALREYESRGLVGRRSMADQRLGALPTRNLHSTIAALTAEATKNLSKDGAKEVGNALAEILLRSLPEGHALERQAARKGVAGAMEDMKRAVAVAGRQNAYYIARLNHAKEVADALHEMGRDAKGDINLEHVYRELEQRHALNMQWHDTPWQDAIGKAAWTWFLGASPAFLAINAAQPWLVSAPVMAGEYGAGAATRELARATADAFKVMKQARWKDGKFDLWSGIDPDTVEGRFMTRNEKGEQVSEERKALRELIQRGVIDEGLNPELAMYAESGGTGLLTKLSRAFGWPAQQVELVNRVATALAAFRLERAKQGGRPDAYQKALDKAYATVVNTHVDYGAENAPRVMREGGGIPLAKLVFQFRRYQQAMMYLLASNVAKLRNPAEQKMARATLGYLALTSGMAGGVVGLPLAGTVMFLKDLFGDDDDEEGDAKARLRNTLYDLTGDKTLADVLAKGIPTLFGMDVAERAGMGQVAQMFPRLDLSRSKTAEDKLGKTLVAVAGPAGGLAVQGMDAASFFGAGDWVRGTERLLPKMMADPLRAARERVTGQEDRKGEQLMSSEELNYWDTIRRVAGVSSVRESDRLEADRALKSVEQGMNDRRSRIHAEFRRALRSGDFEDVRGMIDEYNADHPDMPIKPKDETAWRKEAQRAVSERDPETGLKVTRRQQPLAEVQRFARP